VNEVGVVVWGGRGEQTLAEDARREGYPVRIADPSVPWPVTLLLSWGAQTPWGLVDVSRLLVQTWEMAVPLWHYGKTANDVGDEEERAATRDIVRDLRVPLHSVEFVVVRQGHIGQTFVETWKEEMGRFPAGDRRLAFLRAFYRIKPRLCALPAAWVLGTSLLVEGVPRRRPTIGLLEARRRRQEAILTGKKV